jgi:hypothetical protein
MGWKDLWEEWSPNYEELYRSVFRENAEEKIERIESLEKLFLKRYRFYLFLIIIFVCSVTAFIIRSISEVTPHSFIINLHLWSLLFAIIAATYLSRGLIKNKYQVALEVTTFPGMNLAAARSIISAKYHTKLGILAFIISILLETAALELAIFFPK